MVSLLFSFFPFLLSFSFFLSFFLSFCLESISSLDLNYSGLFFRKIANEESGNFESSTFRELLISQLDHKSVFQLKNLQACIPQKQPISMLDCSKKKKNFYHDLSSVYLHSTIGY